MMIVVLLVADGNVNDDNNGMSQIFRILCIGFLKLEHSEYT